MHYSHSPDKANSYANAAFERIEKEKLIPTPEAYELWFVYFAQENQEICHAIDILLEANNKITDEDCRDLHQKFLNKASENERVRAAGDKIKTTIDEVRGVVSNVKQTTETYNRKLDTASGKLNIGMTGDDVNSIIQAIKNDTKGVLDINQVLEFQLAKSANMMSELQEDLEQVRKEAMTDALTHIGNRKAFDVEMERLMNISEHSDETFSLILFDIDHFKQFNDTYGHRVGDQVLRLVAKTLVDGVKGKDLAVRYGGEEFAILLPDTNSSAAEMLANKLRKDVEIKEVINRNTGEKMGKITMSGGVAEHIQKENADDFIERADKALYKSKNKGRNMISVG